MALSPVVRFVVMLKRKVLDEFNLGLVFGTCRIQFVTNDRERKL
jgi:hypothetical protein